ncbi:MAG: TlpA family protein disulfide reductase [Deltaproteobacteria bacterium]|nr:TlpA family protein disulfide reductase [Deltaproteobacteria bacterium]
MACVAFSLLGAGGARGEPSRDFELYDFADRLVSLKRVRAEARLVVVEFFSEVCKPCKAALPRWAALERRLAGRGLRVVVVAVPPGDADREEARARAASYFKGEGLGLVAVWDKYTVVAKRFGVAKGESLRLPQAFLLDGAGRLVAQSAEVAPLEREIVKRLK